ncbi:hypothetical protein LX32DRAFT_180535 [Colletotrichum zoysiae]|uniref:Uncharacterized protein n=1 Tax=Colletotrichum zoysiae TaxID=1216348 RepID=A0AAD9HNU7_9PEZI|nr:hypothetical protein LX32DRAFT_180535 [Colletotrichum zoysiae]
MLLGKDHEANGPRRRLVILAWEIGAGRPTDRPTASSGANGFPLGNYEKYLPATAPSSKVHHLGPRDDRLANGRRGKPEELRPPYRAGVRLRRIADMQLIYRYIDQWGKKSFVNGGSEKVKLCCIRTRNTMGSFHIVECSSRPSQQTQLADCTGLPAQPRSQEGIPCSRCLRLRSIILVRRGDGGAVLSTRD